MFKILKTGARFALIAITGVVLFSTAAVVTKQLVWGKRSAQPVTSKGDVFLTEGFAFNLLRHENHQWKGPNFGERIDLTQLQGVDTISHPSPGQTKLLMVVAVNPACKMCKVAADEMREVRDRVAPMGIPYYVVSLVPLGNSRSFFQYCESLALDVPAYWWTNKEQPVASLSTMVWPSHLLLDKNGVIIRTWPGSNNDKALRMRMANQIVEDSNVVAETLAVLTGKASLESR